MKILFFSDIHGITKNLNYINDLINKSNFDKIVVLGDIYYSGPSYGENFTVASKEVKDFLTQYSEKLIVLRGNCDSDVDIKVSDFPICNDLALINTDGINIYCTHGHVYSYENCDKFYYSGVLVYGHEHTPYIRQTNDMLYICVGSISLPRNGSDPSYMIYNDLQFTLYSVNGDEITSAVVGKEKI